MNSTLSLLLQMAAFVVFCTVLGAWAYNHWLGIGDPTVSPNPKQKEKNMFAVIMTVLFLAVVACVFTYIVTNGHDSLASLKKQDTAPVLVANPVPVPPTLHETTVQKQIEQELRDVHKRQMALSDAQAATTKADRAHIEKQREQALKAEKLDSKLAVFERFAKVGEGQLKLLEKISTQKPPVVNVTNYTTVQVPTITNIVNVAPSTATFTVQASAVTNIVNVAPAATPPVTIQNVVTNVTVVQPTPVTFTITNVTTGTLTSAVPTKVIVTPKPATLAPALAPAPPVAPKQPAKVKAQKAPATPPAEVQPPTKVTQVVPAPKAPAFKAGRVLVKHINTVTLDKGLKDRGWGIGWTFRKFDSRESKGGQVITREYSLAVDVKTQEDIAVAQSALDLFLAHHAKDLADNDDYVKDRETLQQSNLGKLFAKFLAERTGSNLIKISGMNPEIKFRVLPGPTGT